MLTLYGRDEVVRNLFRLARIQTPECRVDTSEDLRREYLGFLARYQPWAPVNQTDDVFVTSLADEDRLSKSFSEGLLNDMGQADLFGDAYDPETRLEKISLATNALARLLLLADDVRFVFGLAIHSVFIRSSKPAAGARGSHGGSSSASIGAIWLTVDDSVGVTDLMEMYVHELTHHLLFIDELNHAQFNYRAIAKPDNFAHSAILKKRRPLDKVIHSVVVATEVLQARQIYLRGHSGSTIHPPTPSLRAETLTAIDSVYALPNLDELVTPHMQEVLLRCSKAIGPEAN